MDYAIKVTLEGTGKKPEALEELTALLAFLSKRPKIALSLLELEADSEGCV